MSNINLYDKIDNSVIMQNIRDMGTEYHKSGFFGITNPAQGLVMAVTCITENISPIEFGKTYNIIEGRLSMKADAMQAKFQESGGRIAWERTDGEVCEAVFSHKDYCPDGVKVKVTYKEFLDSGMIVNAKGEVKNTWKKHPRQMLRARAISEGVRMVNPSIIAGYYIPEEVFDFDDHPEKSKQTPLIPKRHQEKIKESEDTVISADENHEIAEKFMADNENNVNRYLEYLKWIEPGQTWRDIQDGHRTQIYSRISSFADKVGKFAETRKESANA